MPTSRRIRQWILTNPGVLRVAQRILPAVDARLLRLSGGRVSLAPRGARVLLLTTTGRLSGTPRTTPVIYTEDQAGYLVVASNWGAPQQPNWLLNLRAHPHAAVQIGGVRHRVTAVELSGAERTGVWAGLVASWPLYTDLAARAADRELPVIRLVVGSP